MKMPKKSSKRKFKGSVSRNAAKQQKGAGYSHLNLPKGLSIFKEEPKTRMSFDIIPYEVVVDNHPDKDDEYGIAVKGSLWYKRPYWLHRNVGANNESVICPSSIGKKCPICEHRAQMLKDGADWNDDAVKALKPSMRNLYLVVPIGDKKYDEEVHVWDISQFLFQDKLNEEIQENEENETFPDLEEGYTLKVRFSEETFAKNTYAATSRIDFLDRDSQYEDDVIEEGNCLDNLLNISAYKTIQALFFGGLSQEEAEEEDEDEDEDEVPFEEDEEDEEEEEKKPPVRRKTQSKTKTQTKAKTSTKKKASNKCPEGHKFGKDCEKFDECDDCDLWEKCIDESD